ncbi:hypothetical protein Aduo_018001 [Ancylostoma duodenale]
MMDSDAGSLLAMLMIAPMGYSLVDDGAAYEETPNPTMSMMVSCFEPMSPPTMGYPLPDDGAASEDIQRCR